MKNSNSNFTRQSLQERVDEINNYIDSNWGKLLLLEIFEEVPLDLRDELLEGLGTFYSLQMVRYFQLLNTEYGKEYETICQRVLHKYSLAGFDTADEKPYALEFFKAYASCSRHTGRISLDIAWQRGAGRLYVEYFFLTFNADGIYSLIVVEDVSQSQYEKDHNLLSNMVELDYPEACYFVSEAYKLNVRYMSRPALGRFIYRRYLEENVTLTAASARALNRKVSARLTPRQLGNSMFHALRYQDYDYLLSIIDEQLIKGELFYQFKAAITPGAFMMEGQVEEVRASGENAKLKATSVILQDREVYKSEYQLHMKKDQRDYWSIVDIKLVSHDLVEPESVWNPLALQVYCRVYEILDLDELFDFLDRIDNIREVEELPYGIHMRLTCYEDDLNHGVSFMTGVIADLIVNMDEFVIISQQPEIVDQFHRMFCEGYYLFLAQRGEYEVSLDRAYSYLSGQYFNFEEVLFSDVSDFVYEDGMRYITVRYFVKDRDKARQKLGELDTYTLELYDHARVYYELDREFDPPDFKAEYILGGNWLTVSTFGEKEMNAVRKEFEADMYDALEFDGLEMQDEGLFTILEPDVKKQYPQLESWLKELYLNKWYHSRLQGLRGMSPSEACQTEEGARLLWSMMKKIRLKEKKRQMEGFGHRIGLKEYLRKIDLKLR